MRRITLLLPLILAMLLVGCAGDDDAPTATATPEATASSTATTPPDPTATPTTSPSPSPTETESPTSTPDAVVDLTSDPALDAVIEVVRAGDAAGLAALMQPHEVKCTTVQGMGGPPKCWQDGSTPGEVPDGTVVESFPMPVCELEWQPDVAVAADLMLDAPGEWYAAVSVDGPLFGGETFFGEPYLPDPDRGLIVVTPTGPLLVLLEGDDIVYASRFCEGSAVEPAEFLNHPAYEATVTHRGPAWEE